MRVKYSVLISLLKEEFQKVYSDQLSLDSNLEDGEDGQEELEEANPYHDEKGHWTSEKGAKTYSFTKGSSVDPELQKRGLYKGDGKVVAKMGMNTGSPEKQCGKINFKTGEKKTKTRSCKDYAMPYKSLKEDSIAPSEDDAYLKALVKKEVLKMLKQFKQSEKSNSCRPSLNDFIRFQALLSQAQNPPNK
jgi:hypothetical protein